jgi:hypothetical protein
MSQLDGRNIGIELQPVRLPDARVLTDEAEVLAARRLHAAQYVRIGYLPASAVGTDGTLRPEADPWVPWSRHYGAFDDDGVLRATCRLIGDHAPRTLPTFRLPTFDPQLRARLEQLPAGRLGEISALAREPRSGTEFARALFRTATLDAQELGVEVWLLCVDEVVLRALRAMDPEGELFLHAGDPAPAPVRPVSPMWAPVANVRPEMVVNGLEPRTITLP